MRSNSSVYLLNITELTKWEGGRRENYKSELDSLKYYNLGTHVYAIIVGIHLKVKAGYF